MENRWYDTDPTLSMAVSLLQSAPKHHQELTARYVIKLMEREGILQQYNIEPGKLSFLFPLMRRGRLSSQSRDLLEILKRLPHGLQIEISLSLINYIYLLDTGVHMVDEEEMAAYNAQIG